MALGGANRTYVEMMLDLVDRGKIILPNKLYIEAARISYKLYAKPGLVEQVVQTRIKVYKEFNKYDGYHRLTNYQKFMIDYAIICKVIHSPCHILLPYRAGKSIFYKIITNMWYGDMMQDEIGDTSHNEFLQKRFNISETNEKTYAEQIWEKQNCDLGKNKEGYYDEFTS